MKIFTIENSNTTHDLLLDEEFIISVHEDPISGFRWNFEVNHGLIEKNYQFKVYPIDDPELRRGGNGEYTFQAISKGRKIITGTYSCSWEEKHINLFIGLNLNII